MDAYRYDVVNLTRQLLEQHGLPFGNDVQAAFTRADRAALKTLEARVTGLLTDGPDGTMPFRRFRRATPSPPAARLCGRCRSDLTTRAAAPLTR